MSDTDCVIRGYVVMKLRSWDFKTTNAPWSSIPMSFQAEQGSIGFMEIFDTHENAEKSAAEYDTPTKILAIEIGGT